jgi:hypothetical protein
LWLTDVAGAELAGIIVPQECVLDESIFKQEIIWIRKETIQQQSLCLTLQRNQLGLYLAKSFNKVEPINSSSLSNLCNTIFSKQSAFKYLEIVLLFNSLSCS